MKRSRETLEDLSRTFGADVAALLELFSLDELLLMPIEDLKDVCRTIKKVREAKAKHNDQAMQRAANVGLELACETARKGGSDVTPSSFPLPDDIKTFAVLLTRVYMMAVQDVRAGRVK